MLARVKLALRLSTNAYDAELLDLIASAADDIAHAGAVVEVTPVLTDGAVTDYTCADALTRTAIVTYVRAHFGAPADYDRLKASYDEQKAQMRESRRYGMEEV